MIPKIIHYCWFGRNPKSPIIEKCIASWKKFCPDWEIKEWNEDNFDIIPYVGVNYSPKTMLVNSKMNYPIFKRALATLKWNGETQVIGNTIIIGCDEYGKLMKHHETRTWCDNLPEYHVAEPNKLKKILRNPIIFQKLENSKL